MKTQFEHLEIFEGNLLDNRKPFDLAMVRPKYEWHFSRMSKLSEVKATLRAGSVAWPGCYPLYLITADGGALCFACAKKEWRQIVWDYLNRCSTGWKVVACEINHEDDSLICEHCNQKIPSAYGDDE